MDAITELLQSSRTIAVVGLSDKPDRSSFGVAAYLKDAGYRVIPVNPGISEWQGIPAVADLEDIEAPVDIVDVFRRPEYVSDIVDKAIRIGAKAVWLQLGIRDDEAAARAEAAGIVAVQDRCLAVEHSRRRREMEKGKRD